MLPRDLARRFGRQIRLADVGEAGQERLCAAKLTPRTAGFARSVEERYLSAAGVQIEPAASEPAGADANGEVASAVAGLGVRHATAREVGEGALSALAAIRAIRSPGPRGGGEGASA